MESWGEIQGILEHFRPVAVDLLDVVDGITAQGDCKHTCALANLQS